jgi:hypothetical protein
MHAEYTLTVVKSDMAQTARKITSPENRVSFEVLCGGEWAEWYALSPQQRWQRSQQLWESFIYLGGSLDPEPDTQSPFYDPEAQGSSASYGRPGMRVLRRGGV